MDASSMASQVKALQREIFSFYRQQARKLPWRATQDPYCILVSEIMLQQTQVKRVLVYYTKWLKRWPTADALAKAPLKEVLSLWSGLGYNRRAIHLHRAAQKIVSDFKGDVLAAMHHYLELPGIGKYTAHAVRIFAVNEDIVTVDTNIRRIMIAKGVISEKASEKEVWTVAERFLPKGHSREWHNALMDFGALHLTAHKSGIRPLTRQSRFKGSQRELRSIVLKHLLQSGEASIAELSKLAQRHPHAESLHRILRTLEKEGLVHFITPERVSVA